MGLGPSRATLLAASTSVGILISCAAVVTSGDAPAAALTPFEQYRAAVLADNPLTFNPLTETSGTLAADISGHQNDAEYVGTVPGTVAGPISGTTAVAMTAGGQRVEFATNIVPATGDWTTEEWVNVRGDVFGDSNAASDLWSQYLADVSVRTSMYLCPPTEANPNVGFGAQVGDPTSDDGCTGGSMTPEEWHQVVLRRTGDVVDVFVDGMKTGSIPLTTAIDTYQTMIGGHDYPGWSTGTANAWFSQFSVYGSALSNARVRAHYFAARVALHPRPLRFLVIGDSYSAGNGAGKYYPPEGCYRSSRNYGETYSKQLRAAFGIAVLLDTRACNGAVTKHYWEDQDDKIAQRNWIDPKYDAVFMTFGGNDAKFSTIVTQCLVGLTDEETKCENALTNAESAMANGTIRTRLKRVLLDVGSRTRTDTGVVLLGYPNLERNVDLQFGDIALGQRIRDLQIQANAMQATLVDRMNSLFGTSRFVFAETQGLFSGSESWLPVDEQVSHEISKTKGNPNRWLVDVDRHDTTISRDTFYHPNPTGWAREGELLYHDSRVRQVTVCPFIYVPGCTI